MSPADLTCKNCGHARSIHADGTGHCTWNLKGGPLEAMQPCPCNHFTFDAEVPPVITEEAMDDWWNAPNPVTLTAAAAVGHIYRGDFDPYLEMILAAAHQRKLALRGVRGFPRLDREGRNRDV
jgi:hypothetical protein